MKKYFVIFLSIFFIGNWQLTHTAAVSVIVPKKCLEEKASLVLYMLDNSGNQCVGTCRLNKSFEGRAILPQDLQMHSQDSIEKLSNSIDVTHASQPQEHEIVLYIEFLSEMHIMRVLVVKDTLLADDPFDVLSIPMQDSFEDFSDDFDDLANLVSEIDPVKAKRATPQVINNSLQQYALYAKIYMMMQYKYTKRKLQDISEWLCSKV